MAYWVSQSMKWKPCWMWGPKFLALLCLTKNEMSYLSDLSEVFFFFFFFIPNMWNISQAPGLGVRVKWKNTQKYQSTWQVSRFTDARWVWLGRNRPGPSPLVQVQLDHPHISSLGPWLFCEAYDEMAPESWSRDVTFVQALWSIPINEPRGMAYQNHWLWVCNSELLYTMKTMRLLLSRWQGGPCPPR